MSDALPTPRRFPLTAGLMAGVGGLLGATAVGWLGLPPNVALLLSITVGVALLAFALGRVMGWSDRWMVIAIPLGWFLVFFLVPFFVLGRISLSEAIIARPPYSPLWDTAPDGSIEILASLQNYGFILGESLYRNAYLSSMQVAAVSTVFALLIGYPIAYYIARSEEPKRSILLLMVILPFWTSFLLRVYAWIGFLRREGVINNLLLWAGIIDEPLVMMQTPGAVYVGIVYTYLPFMILPIYSALEKMDGSLIEAAEDLGCSRLSAFWLVTFPLSRPGIIAGCFLVFIPAMGEFVIPSLLGGSQTLMIGKVLWEEFFSNRDWPVASAVAVVLLLLLVVPIVLFQRNQQRQQEAGK